MDGNLYTLRYKEGAKGLVTAYVTASNLAKAEEVGHWFCGQAINRQYIRVEPSVVATEEDLEPEKPAKVVRETVKVLKPMPPTEYERQAAEEAAAEEAAKTDPGPDTSPVTNKPVLERGGKPRVRNK